LFRPQPHTLDALRAFLAADALATYHPLFLQHVICVFHFLEPERVESILEYQNTATVVSSLIALFPTKLAIMPLLISTVMNRTDSLEALESTTFPPPMCARAIAAPPSFMSPDEYYQRMFPKLFAAISAKKRGDPCKIDHFECHSAPT
jgi:hypothetical protein